MARNYDLILSDTKRYVTKVLLNLQNDNPKVDVTVMASAIDDLNKAWDELTDCLVRQRAELRKKLMDAIDELAEEKKESRDE